MPQNPNTITALMQNHNGDLDDFLLDTDSFDGSEEDYLLSTDQHYATLEDELDPISAAAEEPVDLNFDEACDGLKEDITSAYDAKVDADFDKVFNTLNPQAVSEIVTESTFVVPEAKEGTKSLAEYVNLIKESYDKYISEKLEKYSK